MTLGKIFALFSLPLFPLFLCRGTSATDVMPAAAVACNFLATASTSTCTESRSTLASAGKESERNRVPASHLKGECIAFNAGMQRKIERMRDRERKEERAGRKRDGESLLSDRK